MTHQVIVCSYAKDFPWLPHLLTSLRIHGSGFLPPVVCVDPSDEREAWHITARTYPAARIAVTPGRKQQGFMRAQIAMMRADEHCPEADVIYFLGSDCVAYRSFTPAAYCGHDGRPAVLFSSYLAMDLVHPNVIPWRKGVERVIGVYPANEYMRRLPSIFPREIFAAMRAHVEKRYQMPFDDYIYAADWQQAMKAQPRDTSEANILGAYAHRFMPDSCHWVDIATAGMYGTQVVGWPSAILQMWSHGGLDHPADACVDYEFRGEKRNSVRQTPRQIIGDILYDGVPPV